MTATKSIQSHCLDLPPSCIDLCPWDDRYFAIGTYLLQDQVAAAQITEKSLVQQRSGSILLYSLDETLDSFELLETHKSNYAIFDLHFPPISWLGQGGHGKSVWTANSTGSLTCHGINDPAFRFENSHIFQIWEKDVLITYFTFHPTIPNLIGVTLASGEVMLCQLSIDSNSTDAVVHITSHDLESWYVSFTGPDLACFSGGDDGILQYIKMTSLNQNQSGDLVTEDLQAVSPLVQYKDRRAHTAGVTAILPLVECNIFLTGSYDDRLRIIRNGMRPKVLKEENLEGGVWRLLLMERSTIGGGIRVLILASCMHAGCRVIEVTIYEDDLQEPIIKVLAKFEEHESMNYGSTCILRDGIYTVLSTSFYDRRLCLWKYSASNQSRPQK